MRIENLDLDKAKEIITKWAKGKPFITRVYLFGSRITGISKKTGQPVRPDSDLDVAIEFDKVREGQDLFTTWFFNEEKWHKELLNLLGFSKDEHLDLEWYHPTETEHVAEYIESGSIVIYSTNPEKQERE